jgi:hypothetical protein
MLSVYICIYKSAFRCLYVYTNRFVGWTAQFSQCKSDSDRQLVGGMMSVGLHVDESVNSRSRDRYFTRSNLQTEAFQKVNLPHTANISTTKAARHLC